VAVESGLHRALRTWHRHLTAVVCPSRFFVEKFVEWGWRREQLVHVPNWVDAAAFEPVWQPGRHALYFGRLAPEKGLSTLLRACAAAGMPLQLAGTGPEEPALRALALELGADVTFLGFCRGEALHEAVRRARCMVLPSEWYENAPMSVLESMALGTVVVGADIGGIPEIVRPGEGGWLFPSGDADALAARLAEVAALPDAALVAQARAARQRVEHAFSRQRYLGAMLALYQRLGVSLPPATRALVGALETA
jgi:glycosyltransferase involved in cell wall biosynthesis